MVERTPKATRFRCRGSVAHGQRGRESVATSSEQQRPDAVTPGARGDRPTGKARPLSLSPFRSKTETGWKRKGQPNAQSPWTGGARTINKRRRHARVPSYSLAFPHFSKSLAPGLSPSSHPPLLLPSSPSPLFAWPRKEGTRQETREEELDRPPPPPLLRSIRLPRSRRRRRRTAAPESGSGVVRGLGDSAADVQIDDCFCLDIHQSSNPRTGCVIYHH